jgi:hypothetical protein
MRSDFVNCADVRMVQGGGCLRFPVKAFQSTGVLSQLFWKKLQSDETAQCSVLSLEDHTHPAPAQLLDNAVMGNGLADHGSLATLG